MTRTTGRYFIICLTLLCIAVTAASAQSRAKVFGTITTSQKDTINYASVYIKDTNIGCTTGKSGEYAMLVPSGKQTLIVSAMGFENAEKEIDVVAGNKYNVNIVLDSKTTIIDDVVVLENGVNRVRESAYNAIAIDATRLHNSTLDLAGSLAKVPGVKLRESGGVGSDLQFSLDGFSGRHIKFFIDGVPQEGTGSSFGINNIPVNFAERIEVYKGVVPVGFGADALGGVVNIVTGNKFRAGTFVDASYSYGSFNTHRSYINVGHVTKKGLMVDINAFQNYSDNSYYINTPVKDLQTGQIDESKVERVKRFHDTYHNESIIAKVGLLGKSFADRLVLGINLSQSKKEIQNGVRQEIVFGEKRRKGYSIMPSLEYRKQDFFLKRLDVSLTANYNHNVSRNIDTATYAYNWYGESIYNNGKIGEQSYQDSKFKTSNWNGTFTANYRFGRMHSLTLNHVLTASDRKPNSTSGTSSGSTSSAGFTKTSRKNITGLSYKLSHKRIWNVSVFGKYYNQYGKGPRNTSTTGGYSYEAFSETVDAFGYGAAGTYFWKDFQFKLSYEKAYRLPTTDELFGDEDLEMGSMALKPEKSDNVNFNISYGKNLGLHSIYVEGGVFYRDTRDYIRRTIDKYSGGLYFGSHENHGRVKTVGLNVELRYSYSKWLSIGGNLTSQNIRDNEKYVSGNSMQKSTTYKVRLPNIPYFFSNADVSFYVHDLLAKGNVLTLTYDNLYVHGFPLYWENHGATAKKRVPSQFSHNVSLTYSIKNGRYNVAFECRNLTDEKLYDNYSLQKAGRAFYGKIRYFFNK